MLIHEVLLCNVVGGLWVALSAVGTADCPYLFSNNKYVRNVLTLFFDYLSDFARTVAYL
jgi:hypothetical protein